MNRRFLERCLAIFMFPILRDKGFEEIFSYFARKGAVRISKTEFPNVFLVCYFILRVNGNQNLIFCKHLTPCPIWLTFSYTLYFLLLKNVEGKTGLLTFLLCLKKSFKFSALFTPNGVSKIK